jgi:hypothetical protein
MAAIAQWKQTIICDIVVDYLRRNQKVTKTRDEILRGIIMSNEDYDFNKLHCAILTRAQYTNKLFSLCIDQTLALLESDSLIEQFYSLYGKSKGYMLILQQDSFRRKILAYLFNNRDNPPQNKSNVLKALLVPETECAPCATDNYKRHILKVIQRSTNRWLCAHLTDIMARLESSGLVERSWSRKFNAECTYKWLRMSIFDEVYVSTQE